MGDFNINKKRDQGMENVIFVLRFKICIGGVGLKIRTIFFFFLRFLKWDFLDKFSNSLFDGSTFNLF